ncbi:MAG: serine/threonine protein kinase [Planctomycetes bacterium]|nr:serine/threonine protein kinase [Planctomycetota bacterium]
MTSASPGSQGGGGLGADATTKRCGGCGEVLSPSDPPAKHDACMFTMAQFDASGKTGESSQRTLVSQEAQDKAASDRSRKADIGWPEEARAASKDPKNLVNQYILVQQIGKGGMGTVWKAFDRSLLRWVAIKFLTSDGNPEGVARFKREAQLAGGLRHPNIAPIYEVGEGHGQHFIAMEFIEGQSLANAQLEIKQVLEIFAMVAQGVEAAHKRGIVHRDLKPQNVMLTGDGWPYIMDFGLAKALRSDSSLSVAGSVMGTPAYMPPEQAQGKLDQIDAQSDVYSLGATMYAILTRKPPFHAESAMDILMKVVHEEPTPPRKLNPLISADVETIVLKAMAKNKKDRYLSAGALAEDIKRYLSNEEIQATRPSGLRKVARKLRRNPAAMAALASLLVAAIAVGYVATRSESNAQPLTKGDMATPPARPPDKKPDPLPVDKEKVKGEWSSTWNDFSAKIDFDQWKPQDAELADKINLHLREASAIFTTLEIPFVMGTQVKDTLAYHVQRIGKKTKEIANDSKIWAKNQAFAKRAVDWSDMMSKAIRGIPQLVSLLDPLEELRADGATVTGYKGTVTLRIAAYPFAHVMLTKKDGAEVALATKETPLTVVNLEVGDYRLVLKHADHKDVQLAIEGKDLQGGKTYLIAGRMDDPKSFKVKLRE